MANEITAITDTQQLSEEVIRKQLDNGQNLSPEEMTYFITLAKKQDLNPFLKEIYAIKYGNQPAQIVVSKKALERKANEHPQFDHVETGVLYETKDGEIKSRAGAVYPSSAKLAGAYCEVWRKDRSKSHYVEVLFNEYNTGKSLWASKPVTMITKVAEAKAYRETFPEAFVSMYTEDEMADQREIKQAQNASVKPKERTVIAESEEQKRFKEVMQALADKSAEFDVSGKEIAGTIEATKGADIKNLDKESFDAIMAGIKAYKPIEQEPEVIEQEPEVIEQEPEVIEQEPEVIVTDEDIENLF